MNMMSTDPNGSNERQKNVVLNNLELQIIDIIIEGASNVVIAQRCSLDIAKVKGLIKSIMRKTKTRNRTHIAVWGVWNKQKK